MKILIFGLPGAGKTWLAQKLYQQLPDCAWYNANKIREMANDWDFTPEGRLRQATRMRNIANFEKENGRWVICDFVCPTAHTRELFNADISIWVDTISEGRFEDTNKMFEVPLEFDYHVNHWYSDEEIESLAEHIREVEEYKKNV